MDWKRIIPYCTLLVIVLTSTLLVWLPFVTRTEGILGLNSENNSFLQIFRQFDGPLYIIPAKTLYDPSSIQTLLTDGSLPQNPLYYAAHLPLYPLIIRLFALSVGYLKSMIIVNFIATILLSWFFYFMLKKLKISGNPLLLTTVFLFLPRFLVLRSTGAPESLFLLFILVSLFSFEKQNYLLAGLFGALATATKLPGIVLFPAYAAVFIERTIATKKIRFDWIWILLIPVGMAVVFAWYGLKYKDFFAFFHTGATVPMPYPFSAFNSQAKWVGTAWLEDILFYFFFYGITVYRLSGSKQRSFYYFTLLFFTASLFVEHRDISRYTLPLWPFALIVFERFFTSTQVRVIGILISIAIYLYVWNFLLYNVMPITQWQPFL